MSSPLDSFSKPQSLSNPFDGMHQGGAGPGGGGGGADRLSKLTDDLCHRILSFMKAWDVVRTSALSRRWRDLWASAPCLDIRQPCICDDRVDQDRFDEFVKNLLLKRRALVPPRLDTLRLHWSDEGDTNTWISYAIRREASLIELSGKHHDERPEPDYTSFISGNLKILKLTHVMLGGHTLRQLCSRCTSLEELELKICDLRGMEIRSTSLKRLVMVKCLNHTSLSINAPNLVLLHCIRPYSVVPVIENSESLVTASIMLDDSCLHHGPNYQWPPEEDANEYDRDGDFFAYAGAEDSDDINDSESDHENDDSDHYNVAESSESGDKKIKYDESHPQYDDNDHYYDSDFSESGDKKCDDLEDYSDCTVAYGEIAHEYSNKDGDDGPGDYDGGGDGSNAINVYGGTGILRSLSNVSTMDLLAHPREVLLRNELKKCPECKNLKTLSLGEWCMAPDFDALSTILEHSPNLEYLLLHLDMVYDSRDGIKPRGTSFACSNLKMVKITCAKDDIMVHKLAGFFRTNGVPLEKIFVRRTVSTHKGKEARDSRVKRKAQGEAGKSSSKQRKVHV